MKFVLQPWHLMLVIVASWVNREQQSRIEHLQSEVAALKEQIGKKRVLLIDEQRQRLAVRGNMIGRKGLDEVGSLFTRSPNLNAPLEPFFRSLKSGCLNKLILFGETATRKAVRVYLEDYRTERNHLGLGNELILPMLHPPDLDDEIETTESLGGLLRSYRPAA
ncbi:MAG: hypothetical protein ACPGLY_25285 [Rubripirellula sp.]